MRVGLACGLVLASCWTANAPPPAPPPEAQLEWRPEPPKPRPRATPPSATGSLTAADIRQTMARVRGALVACGSRAPTVRGTIIVGVYVHPDGRILNLSIEQPLDMYIEHCVTQVFWRLRFPPAGAPTSFKYPVRF